MGILQSSQSPHQGQGVKFLNSIQLVSGSHEEASRHPEANHPISPSQNFKSEDLETWRDVALPLP
jgi:hypothetical protein